MMKEEGGMKGGSNGIPPPRRRLTRKSCPEGGDVASRGNGLTLDGVQRVVMWVRAWQGES